MPDVAEGKHVKNRLHLDLWPTDRNRDEEVERLIAIGAKVHDDLRKAQRHRLGGLHRS